MQDEAANLLNPTLWRTARVLANERRLDVLRALYRADAGMLVSHVARACHLSVSNASQILRALQGRGFLRAERRSGFVRYYPAADPQVPSAVPLNDVLRRELTRAEPEIRELMDDLTAYTHPRRLSMVRQLASGVREPDALCRVCRLSRQAFARHLDKLQRRGVAGERKGVLVLRKPRSKMAATLRALASDQRPR